MVCLATLVELCKVCEFGEGFCRRLKSRGSAVIVLRPFFRIRSLAPAKRIDGSAKPGGSETT